MKLTAGMYDALLSILAAQNAGFWGINPDRIPTKTYLAISRRGLTESKPHHGVRLSDRGRTIVDRRCVCGGSWIAGAFVHAETCECR